MQPIHQAIKSSFVATVTNRTLEIAASKSFTYPTRLAAAWQPGILEINHPAYLLPQDDIEIHVDRGSTRSSILLTKNPLKKLYKRQMPFLRCDEEYLYDCRFETDKNIAHILAWTLAPALAARKILPDLKVILGANPSPMMTAVCELLELPTICTNRNLYGKIVSIPSGGRYEAQYPSLFGSLDFAGFNQQTPERVFIARKGPRRLLNEQEIEEVLREYGFQKFYYEDIPVSEQWSVTRNARCIVALHGAALSSLVFNHQAVKLIELFHPGYVVDMYRHMVNAVGGTWSAVTGQITADVIRDLDFKEKARQFALRPTKIDPNSLRRALKYMEIDKV